MGTHPELTHKELLADQTSDTTGSFATVLRPCTVWVRGTPDGSRVIVEISPTEDTGDAVPVDGGDFLDAVGHVTIDVRGTYFLRAKLVNAGENTDLNVFVTH